MGEVGYLNKLSQMSEELKYVILGKVLRAESPHFKREVKADEIITKL